MHVWVLEDRAYANLAPYFFSYAWLSGDPFQVAPHGIRDEIRDARVPILLCRRAQYELVDGIPEVRRNRCSVVSFVWGSFMGHDYHLYSNLHSTIKVQLVYKSYESNVVSNYWLLTNDSGK